MELRLNEEELIEYAKKQLAKTYSKNIVYQGTSSTEYGIFYVFEIKKSDVKDNV